MFKTGILVLTSPIQSLLKSLPKILSAVNGKIENTLYVHLAPGFQPSATGNNIENRQQQVLFTPEVKSVVNNLYACASSSCSHIDVRVLLSNISNKTFGLAPQHLQHDYEVILTDGITIHHESLYGYITHHFPSPLKTSIESLADFEDPDQIQPARKHARFHEEEYCNIYRHVVLGGTFDRIHAGHKILLTEACLICEESLLIGVTNACMNKSKTLCELIEPSEKRIDVVRKFLQDVKPTIAYNIVPISDPFGPSIVEPNLECIVVSEETLKGAHAVNKKRIEKGLNELEVHMIEVVEDQCRSQEEEQKISSSSMRARALGTLLRQPTPKPHLPQKPYIIGITGGIASGKSSICDKIAKSYNVPKIDLDKIGHQAYQPGSTTLKSIEKVFGKDIINTDGSLNRPALGAKVFANKAELQKLNEIVWPEIRRLANIEIQQLRDQGHSVVVVEGAVIIEAGWDDMLHELWLSTIPRKEAIKRIVERNNIKAEDAELKIDAQLTNEERLEKSNLVFSTLWDHSVTMKQIERAWVGLQERLKQIH